MNKRNNTKALVMACAAAFALTMGAVAESVIGVEVAKFHQSYPYTGKATVEYTVETSEPLLAGTGAEFIISTDDTSATFVQSNIVAGANSYMIDFASAFGGALALTNAMFEVKIESGGVQLWENGPYWAECNVGAEAPEEYGYYFWWGDTVGYKRENNSWVASDGSASSFQFNDSNTPTYGKDNSTLRSEGYIDEAGNLTAAHDAATAHLGSPWRMPTDAEFSALINNCNTTWTTRNGVHGRLFTGRGAYADRSIFLPAAGDGDGSDLLNSGSDGSYWASTPNSGYSGRAWSLGFGPGGIGRDYDFSRYYGQSVRAVRGFAE